MRYAKRIVSFVLPLVFLVALFAPAWPVFAANGSEFAGGSGTAGDPWMIETPEQLDALRDYVGEENGGKVFALANDIDLTDFLADNPDASIQQRGWNPIGYFLLEYIGGTPTLSNKNVPFCGTLEGNGHTISGLWINAPGLHSQGLFGYIQNASIRNLNIVLDDSKGGISLNNVSSGLVITISVGGLAGRCDVTVSGVSVENCSVRGNMRGERAEMGGLFGLVQTLPWAEDGFMVRGCSMQGAFSGTDTSFGGLAGSINGLYPITFENCHADIQVSGTDLLRAGGLCSLYAAGENAKLTVKDCYAALSIEASAQSLSGFVGRIESNGETVLEGSLEGCVFSCAQQPDLPLYAIWDWPGIPPLEDKMSDDTTRVSAEQLTHWSTFSGWDENV